RPAQQASHTSQCRDHACVCKVPADVGIQRRTESQIRGRDQKAWRARSVFQSCLRRASEAFKSTRFTTPTNRICSNRQRLVWVHRFLSWRGELISYAPDTPLGGSSSDCP